MDQRVTLEDVRLAAARIQNRVLFSPCPPSLPLSEITGAKVYCKLEHLQRTGSFKERGACNALSLLNAQQRKAGVIAASAGNHALGLAYQGKLIGVPVTVVMPEAAPLTKVTNCKRLGADVILHGAHIAESRVRADEIMRAQGLAYINGYDDLAVIAGQGTLGLEILDQVPDVDVIVVPVGGAGLIAGISVAVKSLKPDVCIIGVQPRRAPNFHAAVEAGEPTTVPTRATLADGLAVPKIGDNAFAIARGLVERVVMVDEHQIAVAILRLLELEKALVEGAGATALAACLGELRPELAGRKVVLPLTGGNIDLNILGRVLERGLASDGRLSRFSANISDRPGGLAYFTKVIAEEGASVVEIAHDRAFASDDISIVTVYCTVETRDASHIRALEERLKAEAFDVSFSN